MIVLRRQGLIFQDKNFSSNFTRLQIRHSATKPPKYTSSTFNNDTNSTALTEGEPKAIFEKEFPEYFDEGKFVNRISYVDFIDEALARMKELGVHRNLEAYKELLRVFPPGKYHPLSNWDLIGMPNPPQQLAAIRILTQMGANRVHPDKEVEALVIQGFSKRSEVWNLCARMTYWTMKLANLDPNPLPEKLPEKTYDIAKLALARMQTDLASLITLTSTSSVPESVDRTWVVYSQSPLQKAIIQDLSKDCILYIEESGLVYVHDKYLSYFVLKYYVDEKIAKTKNQPPEPDFNYNTCKVQFYGKPIREKLESMRDKHFDGESHILSTCFTGTSSHDSVLSWLRILERRNPNLSKLNVVFRLKRETNEIEVPSQDIGAHEPVKERNDPNIRFY